MVSLNRARRWMTAGLVVSILGTRIVEGGSDGLVSMGVLSVLWVAVLTSFGEMVSFASPLIAKATARFSPSKVLVASETAEAAISAVALAAILLSPAATPAILIAYLLVAAIFPAITDVVEEFFGQQLAQADVNQALTFNASVYSALAFVGIVVAMPLGALMSGIDVTILVAANLVLSALGALFRLVSSRSVATPPVTDQDLSEFGVLGEQMKLRAFVADALGTGVASPAFSFLTQTGATIGGIYVYLAIARQADTEPTIALATVIAAFGLGATIGPWVGRAVSARGDLHRLVIGVLLLTVALLLVISWLWTAVSSSTVWWLGLAYAISIGVLSRTRAVLTTTLRQRDFRGSRFSRIMSWSFAATALGAIVGSWIAVTMRAAVYPALALLSYAAMLVIATALVMRRTPVCVNRPRSERSAVGARLVERSRSGSSLLIVGTALPEARHT